MNQPNGHVYMVDDNSEIRVHLSALLERYGYSVSSYASAEEFLERSIEITPAVLLLDMRLPGLSGVELQKRLNDAGRGTPIIFISGESRNDEIIDSFRGALSSFSGSLFRLKPFSRPLKAQWPKICVAKSKCANHGP